MTWNAGTLSGLAQFSMPSRHTSVLPLSSPLRHFAITSAYENSTMSRPATFTIHPEEGGRGDFSLAIGSERMAVVVWSDEASQLFSMDSEPSFAGLPSRRA